MDRGMNTIQGMLTSTKASFAQAASNQTLFLPVVGTVVGVVLIALIVIVALRFREGRATTTLTGPLDLYAPKPSPIVVSRDVVAKQMNGSYTLSFYVTMDAVPDMRAAATPLLTWPSIMLVSYNAAQEQLIWTIQQTPDTTGAANPETVTLEGVPMQKWTQVTMALQGRGLDLFVDGQLVKSVLLNNIPPIPPSVASITVVGGGIMGQMAVAQVWSRRLTTTEVYNNYVDTSDSQGRPYIGGFLDPLKNISIPNLFCPGGDCAGGQPAANKAQTWDFPYA
jgi:hypothetical protein